MTELTRYHVNHVILSINAVEAFKNVAVFRRRITGRPCGQVVGEEVCSSRSMSQRIFSGASGMFTLIAA